MITRENGKYTDEICLPKQEPEFQRVIFALREQIAIAKECSLVLDYTANNLRPKCSIPNKQQEKVPTMPGVIGILWEEIENLKAINQANMETVDHFRGLLGS